MKPVDEFLRDVVAWAADQPDLRAVALVGSHARGAATPTSDIDLVLLARDPQRYLGDTQWVNGFGAVERQAVEDYGKVISLRVFYAGGREVEFGLTDETWGAPPLDAGTARVINDGMVVLYERKPLLSIHHTKQPDHSRQPRIDAMTQTDIPIIGTWTLRSFESHTDTGEVRYPYGKDVQGTLIYTAIGRYAVQLMDTHRPRFADPDQMRGTPDEIKAAFEGCLAYYGRYDFDPAGGFVVHYVERSLFPNWEGLGLKRFFELSGDRLKLRTTPTPFGGELLVSRLEWQRIG